MRVVSPCWLTEYKSPPSVSLSDFAICGMIVMFRLQSIRVDLVRQNTITENGPSGEDVSKEFRSQQTLPTRSHSIDDTDTFTRLEAEVETVEDPRPVSAVLGGQTLGNEFSVNELLSRRNAFGYRLGFLPNVGILLNSLQSTKIRSLNSTFYGPHTCCLEVSGETVGLHNQNPGHTGDLE